jgi:hypothetical protein
MLYLYALLGGVPRELPAHLQVATCRRLYAAVRQIDAPPPLEENSLRDHEQTVRQLAASVDAILPVRFGSTFADETALSRRLEQREPELLRALDLVAGREQMTLRVYGEDVVANENVGTQTSGTNYLMAKMQARDRDTVARSIEEIHACVAMFVRAERTERRKAMASVFHLIDRGRGGEYTDRLPDGSPLRFTVSGPWPPYAFGPREIL